MASTTTPVIPLNLIIPILARIQIKATANWIRWIRMILMIFVILAKIRMNPPFSQNCPAILALNAEKNISVNSVLCITPPIVGQNILLGKIRHFVFHVGILALNLATKCELFLPSLARKKLPYILVFNLKCQIEVGQWPTLIQI